MTLIKVPAEALVQLRSDTHDTTVSKDGSGQWVVYGHVCPEDDGVIVIEASGGKKFYVLSAFGEVKFVRDWAADPRCSVSHVTLLERVKRGVPAIKAITSPSLSGEVLKSAERRKGWDALSNFESFCVSRAAEGAHYAVIAAEMNKVRTSGVPVNAGRVSRAMYSARRKTRYRTTKELLAAWLASQVL